MQLTNLPYDERPGACAQVGETQARRYPSCILEVLDHTCTMYSPVCPASAHESAAVAIVFATGRRGADFN